MKQNLSDIPAVILAGGLGTRLRSVVADRPKCLAEINGRPFLAYQLDQLIKAGIRRAVICTGFLSTQVEETFGPTYGTISLHYSPEHEPLGTGGALRNALPLLDHGPLLVMNGDSYLDADLPAFFDFHLDSDALASILLTGMSDVSRYGQVEADDRDKVVGFIEKGKQSGPGWINAGIYIMEHSVVAAIPAGREVSLEREVLPSLIGKGFFARRNPGRFIDIGTPETYGEAARFFEANDTARSAI